LTSAVTSDEIAGRLVLGDAFETVRFLPADFADLLILAPPYNLTRNFGGRVFCRKSQSDYADWFRRLIEFLMPTLKVTAMVYVCWDWRTSMLIFPVLNDCFRIRNRITWEREKGCGAKSDWKVTTEDIWFCTVSDQYSFDVDAVKLKRRVTAPYRVNGVPIDWEQERGGKYRLTHPSSNWTDITVPFWSMRENTDHPTQKPEKLLAKLILTSSHPGDFVFDPFVSSGTTAVVAQKLQRFWCGVDFNEEYLCGALKRLRRAKQERSIQGYADGVFGGRNSAPGPSQRTIMTRKSIIE